MLANVENSAVAIGLERSFSLQFQRKAISKNVQLPHSCTHLTCYQSNFSKQVFNSTWTVKFHMFKLDLEKAEEPEIKLLTSIGLLKKQENSKNIPTSALLIMQKSLTMWITTDCGKLTEIEIPGHLTCLLRNLYAGQEATVRTELGAAYWLQIRKGVRKGCVLSSCLFKLYAE